MSFLERAKTAAAQAAKVAAEQGGRAAEQAAKLAAEGGSKAAATLRDPATKAKAEAALRKAKKGFTTALERIDPRILADVVVKATLLQERANASLRERGSVYRISEIGIGAAIPPSVTFTIGRVDDPEAGAKDSTTLMAAAAAASSETIVTLDGTAIDEATIEEVAAEA